VVAHGWAVQREIRRIRNSTRMFQGAPMRSAALHREARRDLKNENAEWNA